MSNSAMSCVEPTYAYFRRKFEHDLKTVLDAFKAPRYFFPSQINEIKAIIDDIDSLNVFPFLDGIDLEELPAYLAAAEVEDL